MRVTRNVSYGKPSFPINDRIIRNKSPCGNEKSSIPYDKRHRKKKKK